MLISLFGFKVDSPEAMIHAVVWNFIAVPGHMDPAAIIAPSRLLLEGLFPVLQTLAPT